MAGRGEAEEQRQPLKFWGGINCVEHVAQRA